MGDQLSFLFDSSPPEDEDGLSFEASKPLSVLEITQYIKKRFDSDNLLANVSIEGEISNFKRAASGHLYLTLKDDDAQLKAVMWRSSAEGLNFEPQHGDRVVARGNVSVYEPRGEYQLYARTMRPAGVGNLHAEFERLKAQLAEEGLFDTEHKQPLPVFPRRIGIVTSPQAAALQDVLNVLRRRFPVAEVVLSPTLVQGDDAPPRIMHALRNLYMRDDIDVILLVRGGGSLEDLWAFNNEMLVRAVVASPVPVVTGVGHEIDFTLVDFAADQRAPTPSAAAELATPEADRLRMNVDALQQALAVYTREYLAQRRDLLRSQKRTLGFLSPQHDIQINRHRIEQLQSRLQQGIRDQIRSHKERLSKQIVRLKAANPDAILARGYAIVTAPDGKMVTKATDTRTGDTIHIRLREGQLVATVDSSK